MSAPLVQIEGLDFAYGEAGFRLHVDAEEIRPRERVACIGPSGTGKTTLVHLIAGILLPATGRVHLAGQDLSKLSDPERRGLRIRRVGMVFQQFELLDYLSAFDNVLLPYHVSHHLALTAEVRGRAAQLAEAMGIPHVLTRRPRHLSQGERQRVAICRALVTQPELVMCDEPTGNLDPRTTETTLDLLFEQVAARAATLLVVTHNHGILPRFDRVLDMESLNAESRP